MMLSESLAEQWNVVPKLLFFFLNLLIYSTHALETGYYIEKLRMAPYQVGLVYGLQFIPFFIGAYLSNLADEHGQHRNYTVYSTAAYCLFTTLTISLQGIGSSLVSGYLTVAIKTISLCFSGAMFPLIDAMVIGQLAHKGGFSKDAFGAQRMFGSVGHLFATMGSTRFNLFFISHDAMYLLLNLSAIGFMLAILLGIPADLKIEKGTGKHHHHHHPHHGNASSNTQSDGNAASVKRAEEGTHPHQSSQATGSTSSLSIPEEHPSEMARTPSPNPSTNEQDTQQCLRVAERVQIETAPSPAPLPVNLHSHDPGSPVFRLLTTVEFVAFLAFILSAGYSRSIMTIFQKYYVRSVLGMGDGGLDWMELFRTVSEMAIYWTSRYVIAALGPHWVLLISQAAGLLRMLIYSNWDRVSAWAGVYQAWVIYGGELLKGLNTGMLMTSAVKIALDMAPSGCEGSAQGLLAGTFNCLGLMSAGLLTALILWLYKEQDQVIAFGAMFLFSSALTGVLLLGFFVKFAFYDRTLFNREH